MQIKELLGQKRSQLKGAESVSSKLRLTVEPGFAVCHFVSSIPVVHKLLRSFDIDFSLAAGGTEGLSRVRLQQLRPVFAQQLFAGKYIGPNDAALNRHHYPDGILIAQLLDHALKRFVYRGSNGLDLRLDHIICLNLSQ